MATYRTSETQLKEIHERRQYLIDSWADCREQSALDVKAASVDPWPSKERAAREIEGQERPCLSFNEIEQHLNQGANEIAQQDRAIKVTPEGNGANDKTAESKSNQIRRIEYRNKAPQAYLAAVADAMRGSIGYFRAGAEFVRGTFDQEVTISHIKNPWTVFCDPDTKKPAWSDMQYAQVFDSIAKKDFKRRWPKAEIQSFDAEAQQFAPQWFEGERVIYCEDWIVEKKAAKLYNLLWLTQDGLKEQDLYSNAIPKGARIDDIGPDGKPLDNDLRFLTLPTGEQAFIRKERDDELPSVIQRMTNGVEILEEIPWKGSWIPIFPVMGREVYEPGTTWFSGGVRRTIISLVRYARDPQMLYNYFRTTEAEVVGMTPKTPYLAIEGQLAGHEDKWELANKVPLPYLYYKAFTQATGMDSILPPPQRQPYDPHIEALEAGAESARRAIMAAMGMNNTSVGRSDTSAKSGVALKELNAQTSMGIWHFLNSMENAIEQCGRVVLEQLPIRYDAERREVNITKADKSNERVVLNDPDVPESAASFGEHGVTIATGPSRDSQRDAVNVLSEQIIAMQNAPPKAIALAIRMKDEGPLANQLADVFDPPPQEGADPQQMAQELQATQEKLKITEEFAKSQTQKLVSKEAEIESKEKISAENNSTKLIIEDMKINAAAGQALMLKQLESLHMRLDGMIKASIAADAREHEAMEGARERDHQGEMADRQVAGQAVLQREAAELAPKPAGT